MQLQAKFKQARALHQQGQLAQAQTLYQQVLQEQPQHFEALHLLGVIAHQSGRFAQAVELISQALAINPNHALAYTNRGIALRELKQYQAAIADYDRALALNPNDVPTYFCRGNALYEEKQYTAAVASYRQAIALKPDYAHAHSNLGLALGHLKQYEPAVESCNQAIALGFETAQLHTNRGIALVELRQYAAALASYDRAVALDTTYTEAHFNRGFVLELLGRPRAALDSYQEAITRDSKHLKARWNQSMCQLQLGQFETGWENYEWRRQLTEHSLHARQFAAPLWLGAESLHGKTILLHSEGGFGDDLHFCRYAALVHALGARITLEVKQTLVPLLRQLPGVDQVIAKGDALPKTDYQCSLMSLPLAFQTTLGNLSAPQRYIYSDPAKVAQWQNKLGPATGLRVGLVWSGSLTHTNDHNRSIALQTLLEQLPRHIQYISLKKEITPADEAALKQHLQVTHFGDQLEDFTDTAALCELMDLVLSVDTSVAHLAGAMGRPVWILLPVYSDWRWLTECSDSPWYPSARLYRQSQIGNWDSVLKQVAGDLFLCKP